MSKKKTNTKTAESKLRPLEDRQAAFCKEYIIDFNATQAAIRAGYTERSARQTASRLLSNDNIQAEIRKLMEERNRRTEITADRVIQEFAKIAFSDIKDVADWSTGTYVRLKGPEEVDGTLISEIKNTENGIGIKLHDKMKALEALARHTGVYDDRPTVTVDVGSYVNALHGRVEAGDIWENFDNGGPDPKDDSDGQG